ncbi:unnamed protein product [Darwinula stevensoni]|uniref:Uncharacterized protein n=1 Tax=Darwinula stevensoni TaxID=69355 RepID=A0A7R8XBK5_9CRUS|nr:unnamed protein product [Darwinula stevensoni]CAG0892462.1 unnamed protein product [Darwinula stevensoni]
MTVGKRIAPGERGFASGLTDREFVEMEVPFNGGPHSHAHRGSMSPHGSPSPLGSTEELTPLCSCCTRYCPCPWLVSRRPIKGKEKSDASGVEELNEVKVRLTSGDKIEPSEIGTESTGNPNVMRISTL